MLSEFLRDRPPSNHALQVLLLHFPDPLQVRELVLQLVVGAVEPIPPAPALPRSPMNPQGAADRVAKLLPPQLVLLREDLDSIGQPGALDLNIELARDVVDVDARLARQDGGFEEDPKMPAAFRLFQCGLDP